MKIEVNFIRSRKKDIPVNLEDAWRVYEEELDKHIAKCTEISDKKESKELSPLYIETALVELDYFMKRVRKRAKRVVKLLKEYRDDANV